MRALMSAASASAWAWAWAWAWALVVAYFLALSFSLSLLHSVSHSLSRLTSAEAAVISEHSAAFYLFVDCFVAHNWVNNGSSPYPFPLPSTPSFLLLLLPAALCCLWLPIYKSSGSAQHQKKFFNENNLFSCGTCYRRPEASTTTPHPPFPDYPLSIPLPDLTASANGFWVGVGHGFPCQLRFVVVVVFFLLVLFTHFKQADFIFNLSLSLSVSLSVCLPVHLAGFLFNVCFQFYLSVSSFQLQKAFDILFYIPFSFTFQMSLANSIGKNAIL